MQAISSPWVEWISDLEARHITCDNGLAVVLLWDTKRGRDFQNIAQFVYCCDELPGRVLPTAQKLEKWLVREESPSESFKAQMSEVLSEFWVIATENALKIAFKEVDNKVAPVEFVFICMSASLLLHKPC